MRGLVKVVHYTGSWSHVFGRKRLGWFEFASDRVGAGDACSMLLLNGPVFEEASTSILPRSGSLLATLASPFRDSQTETDSKPLWSSTFACIMEDRKSSAPSLVLVWLSKDCSDREFSVYIKSAKAIQCPYTMLQF